MKNAVKNKFGAVMYYESEDKIIFSSKNKDVNIDDCLVITKPLCRCKKCLSDYLIKVKPVKLSIFKIEVIEPSRRGCFIGKKYDIDADGNVFSDFIASNNSYLSELIDTDDLFVMGDNFWCMFKGIVDKFKPNGLDWELVYDKIYLSNGDVYKLPSTSCGEFSSYNADFYNCNLVYSVEVMLNSLIKIV